MKISSLVAFSLLICFSWCLPAALAQGLPPNATQLITSVTTGTPRTDYSGWVGMQITVGNSPLNLTALCRYVLSGNSQNHTVELVSNGAVVNGGSVTVITSGATPGTFACTNLASGITLIANTSYIVLSQETSGGDTWVDSDTAVTNTSDASITNTAYSNDNATFNVFSPANPNQDIVPVGFIYAVITSTSVTFTAPVAHHVDLSWTAGVSASVAGYNIYRGSQAAGPFTQINSSLDTATVYTDSTVVSGQTYYYATTAVDSNGVESGYSNVVQAIIP